MFDYSNPPSQAPDATDPAALQQLQKTLQEKSKTLELLRGGDYRNTKS